MTDWRKWLFYVGAAYDGLLAIVFLFWWPEVYRHFGVPPPNHPGYVQFPALLLLIFGLIFLRIARDPDANRDLIVYGIALKIAYSGIVFWYQIKSGVPHMWIPWAWLDVLFLILFVVAMQRRRPSVR